ncbi:hypothetical protein BBO99_00009605, partial [Phytophthora kernoviae]
MGEDSKTIRTESLTSGKAMMVNGSDALHQYIANTFEAAIGHELPQMEVRYSNLSITANIAVTGAV